MKSCRAICHGYCAAKERDLHEQIAGRERIGEERGIIKRLTLAEEDGEISSPLVARCPLTLRPIRAQAGLQRV